MTITLRQKDLEIDNKSLYLDIYDNGKRKFDRRVEEEELHDKNYGLDVKKAQSESFMRYRKNIKG